MYQGGIISVLLLLTFLKDSNLTDVVVEVSDMKN